MRQRSTRTCHSASTGFSPMRSNTRSGSLRCHRSDGFRSSAPGARYCPRACPGALTSSRASARSAGRPGKASIPRFHEMVPALMGNHTHSIPAWFPKTTREAGRPERVGASRRVEGSPPCKTSLRILPPMLPRLAGASARWPFLAAGAVLRTMVMQSAFSE